MLKETIWVSLFPASLQICWPQHLMVRSSALGMCCDEFPQTSGTVQPLTYSVLSDFWNSSLKHFLRPAPQKTSTACSSQSSQEIVLLHCIQRKPDAMRVAPGVIAKLHKSLSHKVTWQSSTRLPWHGFSSRVAHFFSYLILSLGLSLAILAKHLISPGPVHVRSFLFKSKSQSDHDVSLSHRKQWIAQTAK